MGLATGTKRRGSAEQGVGGLDMPGGRPTKYKAEFNERVYGACLLGATNEDLAKVLDVSVATVKNWLNSEPEFLASVKRGREEADEKVVQSLYNTALEGNTTAQIFWLKNRQKRQWRDKQEVDHQSSDGSMSPTKIEIVAPKEDGE